MSDSNPITIDDDRYHAADQPTNPDEVTITHANVTAPSHNASFGCDDSPLIDTYSSNRALSSITLRMAIPTRVDPITHTPDTDAATSDDPPSLHLMPCRIAHTGPANVPNYFRPRKVVDDPNGKAQLTFSVNGAELKKGESRMDHGLFL